MRNIGWTASFTFFVEVARLPKTSEKPKTDILLILNNTSYILYAIIVFYTHFQYFS
jgi:hypothetical protein